jgi:hypothetical protein
MLRSSVVSVFIHCRVKARKNTSRFEMMHRTRENPTTVNGVRQPAAKVKKEPDTELLISPALKKKILLKEGVDLKRLNQEYQDGINNSPVPFSSPGMLNLWVLEERGNWGNGEMGRRVYECSDEWMQGCRVVWFQLWHSRKSF